MKSILKTLTVLVVVFIIIGNFVPENDSFYKKPSGEWNEDLIGRSISDNVIPPLAKYEYISHTFSVNEMVEVNDSVVLVDINVVMIATNGFNAKTKEYLVIRAKVGNNSNRVISISKQ